MCESTSMHMHHQHSSLFLFFLFILDTAKRNELNTLPDNGRKKQQINVKDNFWPVTGRSKGVLDLWFRDLAGNKPLANLAKKAPSFNKKEEMFSYLCEHQVSMRKAMWFIKLSAAYTTAVTEQKMKKRQVPDPSIEWTATVIRVMRDLSDKLNEHYVLMKRPREPKKPAITCTAHKCVPGKCIPGRCPLGRCIPGKCYPHKCIPGKCVPGKCLPVKCIPILCARGKGPHLKCTKDKCIFKDKKVIERIVKEKSLREKVLKQSLLKDPRFKEMKTNDPKSTGNGATAAAATASTTKTAAVRRKRTIPVTSTLCPTQHPTNSKNRPVLKARRRGHRSAMRLFRSTTPAIDRADEKAKKANENESKDVAVATTSAASAMNAIESIKIEQIGDTTNANKASSSKSKKSDAKRRGYPKILEIIAEMAKSAARRKKRAIARRKKLTTNRLNDEAPASNHSERSPSASSEASEHLARKSAVPTAVAAGAASSSSSAAPASIGQQFTSDAAAKVATGQDDAMLHRCSSHTFLAPAPPPPVVEDFHTLHRQWLYCTKLCKAMCEENLLDRYEFLQWALELVDRMRCKSTDDGFLKIFLPFAFQYMPFIIESERLSRRLAYLVCKKIGYMLHYVTEDDMISAPLKKVQITCCEANITNRLDVGLKIKPEPEVRQPLATRSASTRFKKMKLDPSPPSGMSDTTVANLSKPRRLPDDSQTIPRRLPDDSQMDAIWSSSGYRLAIVGLPSGHRLAEPQTSTTSSAISPPSAKQQTPPTLSSSSSSSSSSPSAVTTTIACGTSSMRATMPSPKASTQSGMSLGEGAVMTSSTSVPTPTISTPKPQPRTKP